MNIAFEFGICLLNMIFNYTNDIQFYTSKKLNYRISDEFFNKKVVLRF